MRTVPPLPWMRTCSSFLPEVEVLDVEAADFGGAGPTHVGRLEQDPVAEDVERHVFARPPAADRVQHFGDVVGLGGAGQGLGHLDGVDLVHGVGAQQVVADGPFAEGGDGGALALAGRRRQLADVGEERADRVGVRWARSPSQWAVNWRRSPR